MEDFLRLENNIIELIKEQQIKLGYRSESVHLYYPMASLNRLMKKQWDEQQMAKKLNEFCSQVEKKLGKLKITKNGDRLCTQESVKTGLSCSFYSYNFKAELFIKRHSSCIF